ncbi:MAG: exodeoxyribonuclease III [Myxococcota bacterium]|nr:exodeoxyribonuclease III [Myxococcota bacterium]
MKFVSWNVNGLRACARKGFVESIRALDADVVLLQETRLQPGQEPKELDQLSEYGWHWHHAERKGYSGVAVLSRVPLDHVEAGFGHERYSVEGRTQVVSIGKLRVIGGYFPNGGKGPERLAYKLDYYRDLLARIEQLHSEGLQVLVTGDMNTSHKEIDLARPKDNRKKSGFMDIERKWMDRYAEAGLVDTFRLFHPEPERYSWWSNRGGARERNVGWRLDYFWASQGLQPHISDAEIHDQVLGSDHCPVSVEIDEAGFR